MAHVELEPLIARAEAEALSDEPLARVAAARDLGRELNLLGDEVVDHFVLEARRAGCSWAQIGSVLGVTRQGAQQRYGIQRRMPLLTRSRRSSPLTRFGPDARRAVVEAQAAARAMGHGSVDTVHLLVGILASGPDGVGSAALESCGLERGAIEAEIAAAVGRGATTKRRLPFAPGAKQALELSLREALALGSRRIGSEHLALALLRDRRSLAARVLARHDVDHQRVLAAVVERGEPPGEADDSTGARPAP
jgi:hypothetical protein